jgi:hypothetical protein
VVRAPLVSARPRFFFTQRVFSSTILQLLRMFVARTRLPPSQICCKIVFDQSDCLKRVGLFESQMRERVCMYIEKRDTFNFDHELC